MRLAHFLSLLRGQQFEQTDLGLHHAVDLFRFDLGDVVGHRPHLGFLHFPGMHQLFQFHMRDLILRLQHDSLFGELEFHVFDLPDLRFGQPQGFGEAQHMTKGIFAVPVAVTMTAITVAGIPVFTVAVFRAVALTLAVSFLGSGTFGFAVRTFFHAMRRALAVLFAFASLGFGRLAHLPRTGGLCDLFVMSPSRVGERQQGQR